MVTIHCLLVQTDGACPSPPCIDPVLVTVSLYLSVLFPLDGVATTEGGEQVALKEVLAFFTGAAREPPLGFHPKPTLDFAPNESMGLATAVTCSNKLTLPVCHYLYENFKSYMTLSVKGHGGFGRV